MQQFCVQGIVKNGQVVMETPLGLPDGTTVTVTNALNMNELVRTNGSACSDAEKRKLLTAWNRLDLIDDPDWQEKATEDRIAAFERLVLEAAKLRESRLAPPPEPEQQTASCS